MKGEADAAPSSKKKTLVIIIAVLLAVALGGGGAWFFMRSSGGGGGEHKEVHKETKAEPPVFVAIDPFTVNLQQENGEQYLQTAFTLQVGQAEQGELIKANMPQVRSRLLLLLSSKKASELSSTEGKKALSAEIITLINQPFSPNGEAQKVTGVFFTSFIVQ